MNDKKQQTPGIVEIHGKLYKTVARRIRELREAHPEWTIKTDIIERNQDIVVMLATILDGDKVIGTGHAEEIRDRSQINKTSAVENCETSAIGRALASCGYISDGDEFASADEIKAAIEKEQLQKVFLRGLAYGKAIEAHRDTIEAIQTAIAQDNLETAVEAYEELTNEDKMSIYLAPSKGGPFTTREREIMKSPEWMEIAKALKVGSDES